MEMYPKSFFSSVYGQMNYSNKSQKVNNPFTISVNVQKFYLVFLCHETRENTDGNNLHIYKFILFCSFLSQLLTLFAIATSSSARKIIIKSNPERNADLFQDKDFTFSQDKEDRQEPTIFKGDPMKTK
jgi:hypothetical protein